MSTFKSTEKIISADLSTVYGRLSNLETLQGMTVNVPDELKDNVGNLRIEGDTITISVNPVGDVSFKITKRVENELIRLEAVSSPLPFNIDVHLSENTPETTKAMAEIKIELNPIIKPMISKPLQDAAEKFGELLTVIPYNK